MENDSSWCCSGIVHQQHGSRLSVSAQASLCWGGHNYCLFEIGTIKGCHPCLSSLPPYLWTVEEIASLQGSVPNEWAEGKNLSSKNQKRPHGSKYFQVARNSFLDSIFWNSLNHMWNLIHKKKDKRRWETGVEKERNVLYHPEKTLLLLHNLFVPFV